MKRLFYIFTIALSFVTISCNDYLDTYPGDQYDDATIWKNTELIESFIYGIYGNLPYPFQWYTCGALVDESVPIQVDGVVDDVLNGRLTPENLGVFQNNWANAMDGYWWGDIYSSIRACNLFFEKIEIASNTPDEIKEQLTGEVHFLRAYFYFLLMEQYGGVPLIDRVINIGENYNIPRNTFEETVDFIVSDLDAAIINNRLSRQTDKTRATEGAVYALKSRVLVYAASELYHNNGAWTNGYPHPELIGYTAGSKVTRRSLYEQAKAAAEKVFPLGYSLYNQVPNKTANYQQVFLQMSSNEQILINTNDKKVTYYYGTDWMAWVYGPPSYGGFALNQVTGNFVNAFENTDGTQFNFNSPLSNPYVNRDPRLEATVLHNGSGWYKKNTSGVWVPNKIDINGIDKGTNSVTTGYFIKKFISPLENDYYYGTRQPQPYMFIRYAEVLLNYSEACLGLGEENQAKQALNQLRSRAGMPDITPGETGQALIERYRNERRVEMAFENQRFFDVRRWMIAENSYREAYGVTFDGTSYKQVIFETHHWNPSHYFIPILYTEMQKNTALIQNPGY
jgi:starch-binding outer membrane protein, SusD/RagB family